MNYSQTSRRKSKIFFMNRNCFLRRLGTIVLCMLGIGSSLNSQAQTWPNRAVTIVVPFNAGGPTDVTVRKIAARMSENLGQPVVIENKPGGGATIGAQYVARAKPDGYTLLISGAGNFVINPILGRASNYDALKSFKSVSLLSPNPNLLVASKASGIKTLEDVVRVAKDKPGHLTIASYGVGTPGHLAIELLKSSMNIDVIHVPYSGSAAAAPDFLAGRVSLMMDIVPSQFQNLENGSAKAIALAQVERSSLVPNIPTFNELGFSELNAMSWAGLSVPTGTPDNIIARLNKAVRYAIADKELQDSERAIGSELRASTPGELDEIIRGDLEKWGKVIKDSKIKLD